MTIALDGTPLTVSTGGVARYTLELARALAAEFPEDRVLAAFGSASARAALVSAESATWPPPTNLADAQMVALRARAGDVAARSRSVSWDRFLRSLFEPPPQRDDPPRSFAVGSWRTGPRIGSPARPRPPPHPDAASPGTRSHGDHPQRGRAPRGHRPLRLRPDRVVAVPLAASAAFPAGRNTATEGPRNRIFSSSALWSRARISGA